MEYMIGIEMTLDVVYGIEATSHVTNKKVEMKS